MTSPTPLRDMYQQHRAQQSGSVIYQPVAEQPKPKSIYVESGYQGLGGYERKTVSVTDREPGESDYAFQARQSIWARHLEVEAAEQEGRERAEQAALDVMQGRGLDGTHGMFDASDRQAYHQYASGVRADGTPIERHGHLGASAQQTPGQPSLDMLSRLPRKDGPVVPQRPEIPAGASGTGWL